MRVAGLLSARLAGWVCVLWTTAPAAAEDPFSTPRLTPVQVATPPIIDGVLDDECWREAIHVDGFWEPAKNKPETERTEAWLCLDGEHLYAAFYAHDSQPETILAQQTQRGGSLERDDYVALHIDTSRRMVDHYSFRVSANGTQNETIPDSGSSNVAWSGNWYAAAQRVPDGYVVEMAIPFTTLRYPKGQTEFGVAFARNFERLEEADFWPWMRNRFEQKTMAVFGPLELAEARRRPALLPYAIARLDDDGATIQSGLDIKHVFANNARALLTLNPDFRNIEDVVETIAYSDTERLLGETRPFFREGSKYLPGNQAFNSRRLPDVTAGVKTYGTLGPSEFGLLGVVSDRGRLDLAGEYTHNFTPEISLGSGFAYLEAGPQPTNLATHTHFDARHPRGTAQFAWGGDHYQSWTKGPGGDGTAWNVYANWGGERRIAWNVSYNFIDPEYRALIGYVPENDQRGWSVGLSSWRRDQENFIQRHDWYVNHSQRGRSDGSLLQSSFSAGGSARFANGTSLGLSAYSSQRPPNRDRTVSLGFDWGLETLHEEGGLDVTTGSRGGGRYLFAKIRQGWAPLPQLRFSVQTEYVRRWPYSTAVEPLDRTQSIVTATWEFNPYSNLSARFVERDGRLNLFVAYRNAPPTGRSWVLFFGDPNTDQTEARVQLKFIWPL